ncbi:C4-dicarboxylate TRAP transporter substrate-binding protein [Ectothiorhodospiraceae bacterium WFHF3C12]|nr:C4-dicarboxylate TRAP transporter substrate-binding protein [Ectothiorhodospiraceae bacterium WFHF3C12]
MLHKYSLKGIAATAAVLAATSLTSAVEARQLNYAIGFPSGAIAVNAAERMADTVENRTDGEVTVKVYPMSLLDMAETPGGVKQGLADAGFVLTQYNPSEFAHTNLVSESTMVLQLMGDEVEGRQAMAYAGAIAEFVLLNCPECNQEFADQNQVYTGAGAGTSYGLVCNTPVTNGDELEGKRLRVGASQWARWASAMDASPVSMTGNEMYEALDQGVVDCVVVSAPEIHNFNMLDVVTDLTMAVPGGIFTSATVNVNERVWDGLDENARRALLRGSAEMAAMGAFRYHALEGEVMDKAREAGVAIHKPSDELVKQTRRFIRNDLDTMAETYQQKYGVKRGEEMLADLREILDKWVALVQDVDNADELAQLYWDEIHSRVDVSEHGL